MWPCPVPSITQPARRAAVRAGSCLALFLGTVFNPVFADDAQRALFADAWTSARTGDRAVFDTAGPQLRDYPLYPYWQYEDYRHRRSSVPAPEMAAFLEAHDSWAFTAALRSAWLKTLGKQRRWKDLLSYAADATDAEIQCQHARARLETGPDAELLQVAQKLWTVGHSQDDACDPLFRWLREEGGITPALTWERIRLAMKSGNPRLTLYLEQFLPVKDREWLRRWQELNRTRYRHLDRSANWPDNALTRIITGDALRRLARHDPVAAIDTFAALDGHFQWDEFERGDLMREIGLMAAVDLLPESLSFLPRVPEANQDDQLLQWWARSAMAANEWAQVREVLSRLSPESAGDGRWRYWLARSEMAVGDVDAGLDRLHELASSATFHGFLAADDLQLPYAICAREPEVSEAEREQLRQRPDIARALELRAAGIDNWALSEWVLAAGRLAPEQLKIAAAVALEAGWHDRAIFALGDSGDLHFYEWRFPLLWNDRVTEEARRRNLDPAWIYGVMRAESAMTERARSSANAMGLMQVTPGTARQISRRHGMPYRGTSQLLEADQNIRFGAVYLRDLMDRFANNPVLVSAAYNAGPEAAERWLKDRPGDEAALWAELLPYYETRDYIPRVLAFTTIYEWRMAQDVPRVSSRMPGIESGKLRTPETTEVVCPATAQAVASP